MISRIDFYNDLFYLEHLSEKDSIISEIKRDFSIFKKSGKGLEIYLKELALIEEKSNENRTYIIRDRVSKEIAGYFSLKAGLISIDENIELLSEGKRTVFETLPGIELAEFAVNDSYIKRNPENKGCGIIIFCDIIIPFVKMIQKYIGVKVLYIFALPEERLLNIYIRDYKFKRLEKTDEENLHSRLKPVFDKGCIFMYQLI